jgi:hypothetical protein
VEVKNMWSYTSTPEYVFMVWWLIKQWLCVFVAWYLVKNTLHFYLLLSRIGLILGLFSKFSGKIWDVVVVMNCAITEMTKDVNDLFEVLLLEFAWSILKE